MIYLTKRIAFKAGHGKFNTFNLSTGGGQGQRTEFKASLDRGRLRTTSSIYKGYVSKDINKGDEQ